MCTIHPKPFNSIFDISIFDVFLYKDNAPLLHHYFVKNRNQIQRNKGDFVFIYDQENYIKKTGDQIELAIKDDFIDVHLFLKDILGEKHPKVNELIDKRNDESQFNWIVFAPYCEGKASIVWKDYKYDLKGNGYHDYNSGAANLKQIICKWYWGKYYFNDELLIYGEILAKNGKTRRIALWVNREGYAIDDNPELMENNQEFKFKVATKEIIFKMQPKKTIDSVVFYMSRLSGVTTFVKISEALYYFSSRYSLTLFTKLLGNTRYIRSRTIGKTLDNKTVSCFYEEMFF